MYSYFCEKYGRWANVTQATIHIQHKPGDTMQFYENLIGHRIYQWPVDPGFLGSIQNLPDGVVEARQLQFHGAHALVRARRNPQDVFLVEQRKFLLDKCHTVSCADIIIEGFSRCGCFPVRVWLKVRADVALFPKFTTT